MQGERAPPAAQGEREPQATGRADLANLDYRLREIERKAKSGAYARKKEGLAGELEEFLRDIPGGGDLATVNEQNIRRFLVHKDRKGRTQTHGKDCKHLGAHGLKDCECPRRLAASSGPCLGSWEGGRHGTRARAWGTRHVLNLSGST